MNIYEMLIRRSRPAPEPPEPSDSSSSGGMSDSSSSGWQSDSGSSSGGVTPVVPTDYSRRYELISNLKDSKHSSTTDFDLVRPSYANISYGTADGITGCLVKYSCLYNLWSGGITTDSGCALSLWAKCSSVPSSSSTPKCLVNMSQYWTSNAFWLGYRNGRWAGGTTKNSVIESSVEVDASWHCLVLNFDKTGETIELWLDGELAGEITGVSSVSISSKGMTVNAGDASQGENPDGLPDVNVRYRDVTWFARTLSEAEILGLSQEH